MPAPTIVTPQQVSEAAAKLAEQGKAVTGWTLRGVIGSGRPDRLLAVWREQQGIPEPEPAKPEDEENSLLPDFPPHLVSMADEWAADMRRYLDGVNVTMWRTANAAAEHKHCAEVDRLRTRVRELEGELDHASYQVESLEGLTQEQYDEAHSAKMDAARQVAAAREEVKQARAEADGHREANIRLQATLDELVRRLPAVERPEAA